ncbi:unnamed protein product [Euphydryas editha]|uniref:Uncharacterized protein n=1 Tax=Euphydryas editha TaxID=104508 RepID=A0AAU9USX7_EUPED|nr:unnamed protein product [Euphydryas editha]
MHINIILAVQRPKDPAQQPDLAGGGHAVPVRCQAAGRARARGGRPHRVPPRAARPPAPPPARLRLLPPRVQATDIPLLQINMGIFYSFQEIEIQSCGRGAIARSLFAVVAVFILRLALTLLT